MRLVFIRHGDPDYVNDSLTEKGFREAALLGKRAEKWKGIDAVYLSPLGRAQKTAEPVLSALNMQGTTLDWLREFFVLIDDPETGKKRIAWDFMPADWTREPQFFERDEWFKAPRMQTGEIESEYKKVCEAIDGLLLSYGYERTGNYYKVHKQNDCTLVFICHYGITMTLLSHLLNISPVLLWHGLFCAPTSVTVLATEERVAGNAYFRASVIGDTTHLHDGNEPVSASGYFTRLWDEGDL